MGVKKRCVARGKKKILFSEEDRGINVVYGPKYRLPVPIVANHQKFVDCRCLGRQAVRQTADR
jgi:hypothetical protein